MGFAVVGRFVGGGATVGELVGLHVVEVPVGPVVGATVVVVGALDGAEVRFEGDFVGFAVGGSTVGDLVGLLVLTVGDWVGDHVLVAKVGDTDGATVSRVG